MKCTPRDYQQLSTTHQLDVKRGATFAGMGMGKTLATYNTIDALHLLGHDEPTLVLAPLRVAQSTWPDEAQKWDHLRNIGVRAVVGTPEERLSALRDTNANVFTINYENIEWLLAQFKRWPFATVVADESTKLKSFRLRQGGERTAALGKVAHLSSRWINLTGTPAPNGMQDLWGQTWFLDKGQRLGKSYSAYMGRWFRRDPSGFGHVILPHAQGEIESRIKDICLTVRAKDYFDLKKPIVVPVKVELPRKAFDQYKRMEQELFVSIEGHDIEAFSSAAKSQKCMQLANGAVYLDPNVESEDDPRSKQWKEVHDVKIQALESIIAESGGMPILVAYNFKSDLARLQRAFPKGRVLDNNPRTITEWSSGAIPILFAHPASAGHGLNLQDGGNILVFFGLNWNLEEHEQIIERIGPTRQLQSGYDRPVFLYYIIASDTIDETILERLRRKAAVQDAFQDAMR